MTTFQDLGLSSELLQAIEKKGYTTPSPIQAGVIPLALGTNKDIVGQAQTGSGKTAAFGLPILDKIDAKRKNTQAIILTPTRELAIQIAGEIESFALYKKVSIGLFYGGQPMRNDLQTLKSNPQIIVGTPGRIHDHLRKKRISLDTIEYFVLDEADEMLNIGFKEEIEEILQFTPKEKKVFLFSATIPDFIKNIIKHYMRDYETVAIEKTELTNSDITQVYYETTRQNKFEVLGRIIDITPDFYGIIFCQTKIQTDEVAAKLSQKGYLSEAIHGDIEQSMREKVLGRFKKRHISILVATDVAARGIDVSDLTHVVNFELPDNPESYTHRIGRTGRAGKTGTAISLISRADKRRLAQIERITKKKIELRQLPNGEEIVTKKIESLTGDIETLILSGDANTYLDIAGKLLENNKEALIISALLKKFYKETLIPSSYKELKGEDFSREGRGSRHRDDGMVRLFVARGRRDDFQNPGQLLSFIAREAGLGDLGAGRVDIMQNFSYVDLPYDMADIVLKDFKQKNPSQPMIVKAKQKPEISGERRGFRGGERRGGGGFHKKYDPKKRGGYRR